MQALVYRVLVDAKLLQAETFLAANPEALASVLNEDLGFDPGKRVLRK